VSEAAAVRDAVDALLRAFDEQDLDAVIAVCHPNLVFIGSAAGEEAQGRNGPREMFHN